MDEWYHCYTRGIDKRRTFQTDADYKRFIQILYLANNTETVHRSDLKRGHDAIFAHPRERPLVGIGAYCIMPNHFHILMQEITEGGIVKFMQKVGTAYAMYFNIKNQRVGNLFVKPFRSKHVDEDTYLWKVAQYIHLNPVELYDHKWKQGGSQPLRDIEKKMRGYTYSSLLDYSGVERPEGQIIHPGAKELIAEDLPELPDLLEEAAEYYRELAIQSVK